MAKKKRGFPWLTIFVSLTTFILLIIIAARYGEWLILPSLPEKAEKKSVTIFFSGKEGRLLEGERREIKGGSTREGVEEIIADLISGPKGKHTPTIPEGTRLLGVRIRDGVAFINFSKEIYVNHPGGSSGELQTIYSIVNTVTLNFPQIKAVQITVEGERRKTLAGHVEIDLPLGPDLGMIGEASI